MEKCSNAEEEISRILRKSYQDDLNNMANMNGRMAQVIKIGTDQYIFPRQSSCTALMDGIHTERIPHAITEIMYGKTLVLMTGLILGL